MERNRRPQRHEERQCRKAIDIFNTRRLRNIAVQNDIGRAIQFSFDEIHQEERKIVEHVTSRYQWVKLDSVERNRPIAQYGDVSQMQVAVTATNISQPPACQEQRSQTSKCQVRCPVELLREIRGKEVWRLTERARILIKKFMNCSKPGFRLNNRSTLMHGGDRGGEFLGKCIVDTLRLGKSVERLVLIEADHFDRPFNRRAVSANRQSSERIPRNWYDATVKLGGECLIDRKLILAGRVAFRQS